MIELHPLPETEFDAFKAFIIEDYAQDLARNQQLSQEDARANSAKQINGLLSAGLATPRHHIYNVVRVRDGTAHVIGYLWVDVDQEKKRAFIFEIQIQAAYRGQGWGQATLHALEQQLRAQGITQLGLHVFAHNAVAQRLYAKMGYQVTGLNMQKQLTAEGTGA